MTIWEGASRRGLAITLAAMVLAAAPACRKTQPVSGTAVDLQGMDKSIAPGDDFNAYANGGWIKATPIPPDKSSYGVATILVDQTRQQTVAIIQDPVNAGPNATPDARKIGDFYSSFLDEAG